MLHPSHHRLSVCYWVLFILLLPNPFCKPIPAFQIMILQYQNHRAWMMSDSLSFTILIFRKWNWPERNPFSQVQLPRTYHFQSEVVQIFHFSKCNFPDPSPPNLPIISPISVRSGSSCLIQWTSTSIIIGRIHW